MRSDWGDTTGFIAIARRLSLVYALLKEGLRKAPAISKQLSPSLWSWRELTCGYWRGQREGNSPSFAVVVDDAVQPRAKYHPTRA